MTNGARIPIEEIIEMKEICLPNLFIDTIYSI